MRLWCGGANLQPLFVHGRSAADFVALTAIAGAIPNTVGNGRAVRVLDVGEISERDLTPLRKGVDDEKCARLHRFPICLASALLLLARVPLTSVLIPQPLELTGLASSRHLREESMSWFNIGLYRHR